MAPFRRPVRPVVDGGFTLVELVAALLVMAALGIAITSWLSFGSRIYVDSAGRSQALDDSRFAVERLSRELRGAAPASVRLSGDGSSQCLEWLPQRAAGSYLSLPVTVASSTLEIVRIPGYSLTSGDLLLVAALDAAQVYTPGSGRRAALAGYAESGERATLTLTSAQLFAAASPGQRFYIVATPVSYCVRAGALYRHSGYPMSVSQPLFSSGGVLMMEHLVNRLSDSSDQPFVISPATLQRESLVQIRLRAAVAGGADPLEFFHTVQTPNVP